MGQRKQERLADTISGKGDSLLLLFHGEFSFSSSNGLENSVTDLVSLQVTVALVRHCMPSRSLRHVDWPC